MFESHPSWETKAMRRFELVLLSVLFVCCLTARAADKSDDTAKWQGTWKMVSCIANGEPQSGDVQWVVEGNRYTVRIQGKSMETSKITLDASQKHVDIFHHDTPKGTYGGKLKGIYEIKADSLKVCYDLTGERYPKSFDAGPGSRQALYQFQRERR
jgi:uncharacterized protein (TIGR03067 family)